MTAHLCVYRRRVNEWIKGERERGFYRTKADRSYQFMYLRTEIEQMKKLDWYFEWMKKIESLSFYFLPQMSNFLVRLHDPFDGHLVIVCCYCFCWSGCCSLGGNIEFRAAFKSFNHTNGSDSSRFFWHYVTNMDTGTRHSH